MGIIIIIILLLRKLAQETKLLAQGQRLSKEQNQLAI